MAFQVFIAADHHGVGIKSRMADFVGGLGHHAVDLGSFDSSCASDYPQYSLAVAEHVARTEQSRGILVCMTGIGHSIAANKVPGAYAALCYNTEAAVLSRQHNNSNILILGAKFVPEAEMFEIIRAWLGADFEGGRHLRRFQQIQDIEKKYLKV